MATVGPTRLLLAPSARRAILGIDAVVRRSLAVREFADDADCILRVAVIGAPSQLILADGAVVEPGDPVIELHFWNEHLGLIRSRGVGFGAAVHRRLLKSLRELAAAMRAEARLSGAKAVCAHMTSSTHHDILFRDRFVARFGFEVVAEAGGHGWFRRLVDDLWQWSLTFAIRPHTLRSRRLLRSHYAVWISRAGFMSRFGNR